MNKLAQYITSSFESVRLKKQNFILISNNCWGFELYHSVARPYNTPFIGLFLYPDCYIQLLENFDKCINDPLTFKAFSKYTNATAKYPIGSLANDVEIHFLHYDSEADALDKWNRRVSRLKEDISREVPIFVKFCDRDGCTSDHLSRFHKTPFKHKLSISTHAVDHLFHFYQPELKDTEYESVVDGLNLFRKRYKHFDITHWIRCKTPKPTYYSKILSCLS